MCVSLCVFVCLCAAALNANSSKTVKATDFKFDMHVPRGSPDMTLENLSKRVRGHGHVTSKFKNKLLFYKNSFGGDMHSHEHFLVIIIIIIIIILASRRRLMFLPVCLSV